MGPRRPSGERAGPARPSAPGRLRLPGGAPAASALGDDAITIGSFDFSESEVLAQLYGQALQAKGYDVTFEPARGPRELLLPALQQGVIELLPEYAGTALQFVSLGSVTPSPEPAATNLALRQALAGTKVEALDAAPAENSNRFVVTRATADRYGLDKLSDLQPLASSLRFGGPPECPSWPFCLEGLRRTYQVGFESVLSLDAGGPLTHSALRDDYVDVALLFSTDPALSADGLVYAAGRPQPRAGRERDAARAHGGPPAVGPAAAGGARRRLEPAHHARRSASWTRRSAAGRFDPPGAAAAWLATKGLGPS